MIFFIVSFEESQKEKKIERKIQKKTCFVMKKKNFLLNIKYERKTKRKFIFDHLSKTTKKLIYLLLFSYINISQLTISIVSIKGKKFIERTLTFFIFLI